MICKYRHGGARNTTPISTPTNQPSNSPNSHQDQYFCTYSGLPCSLPQPIPIPTTGGKHHGDTSHRGTKPLDPSISTHIQNKSYQLWGNPTTTGTSTDTSATCPPASTPLAPPSTPATCIRSPDAFNGSNLDGL